MFLYSIFPVLLLVSITYAQDDVVNDTVVEIIPNLPTVNGGNRKYYFGTVYKGNYFQAIEFCNFHDMSLLSIESEEENNIVFKSLVNFVGNGVYSFWTSGTLLPENHWVWLSTGKPLVYTPWTKHPDNKNNRCLDVAYRKATGKLVWSDVSCSVDRHPICETILPKSVYRLEESCKSCNLTLLGTSTENLKPNPV